MTDALQSLRLEGLLGALLTGGAILLMLGSLRSALVVVMTIPVALLSAVVALWAAGQSINLMTLGGLTLAIGILVDESVIAIENIHRHLSEGKPVARAVLEASREVVIPRLLIMLCMLAVFAPSFFMSGVARAMFVPLALAVGFAMASSYFLASSFVPILETWLNRKRGSTEAHARGSWFDSVRSVYAGISATSCAASLARRCHLPAFAPPPFCSWPGSRLGTEIFPRSDPGMLQMRLRAPTGTRVERTEVLAQKVLTAIQDEVGPENVERSLAFVGVQPSSFPVNLIFLWTGGPHEAVILVDLKKDAGISTADVQERLRQRLPEIAPGSSVTFEAADLVSQVMSFGAPTPIEVAVSGADLEANRAYAGTHCRETARHRIPARRAVRRAVELSDSRHRSGPRARRATGSNRRGRRTRPRAGNLVQPLHDAGLLGRPQKRHRLPGAGRDPAGEDLIDRRHRRPAGESQPRNADAAARCGHVAEGTAYGEYHRNNMQRMITVNANVAGSDLGSAAAEISSALQALPAPPRGVTVSVRGQIAPMNSDDRQPEAGPEPVDRRRVHPAGRLLSVAAHRPRRDPGDSRRARLASASLCCSPERR